MVERFSGYSAAQLAMYGVLASAVASAVRFAWIYPATWLPRLAGTVASRINPIQFPDRPVLSAITSA